jgi:glucosamine--fructose-6-phosphate aminotransferase (isomerizing)
MTVSTPGAVMAAEMGEQPHVLARLLGRADDISARLRAVLPDPLAGTVLLARGSSDHAATYGRYVLELATGRPVASASPSLHMLYGARVDYAGYLVIAVSQSGRTPEVVEVVDRLGRAGARTLAITNDESSPLAQVADTVIALDVGEELAVPATKTVTAQFVAFALLAQAMADIGLSQASHALADQISELLRDDGWPTVLAERLAGVDRLLTVARGLLYGAAAELSLKLLETTSMLTAAYSTADLRHGPVAVASTGLHVLALAHPGPALHDVSDLVADLRLRGASVTVAGPVPNSQLPWPKSPEVVAPVLAVVRGQQLALALARLRGLDPDRPRGLAKVTLT